MSVSIRKLNNCSSAFVSHITTTEKLCQVLPVRSYLVLTGALDRHSLLSHFIDKKTGDLEELNNLSEIT